MIGINDIQHNVSLEEAGIASMDEGAHMVFFEDPVGSVRAKMLGRKHAQLEWRENVNNGVHLADRVRIKFWNECVMKFFDY